MGRLEMSLEVLPELQGVLPLLQHRKPLCFNALLTEYIKRDIPASFKPSWRSRLGAKSLVFAIWVSLVMTLA